MTQQTEQMGQTPCTVSVGGFTFAAKQVTYWPGNPAQMSRLDILVERGSDADFKLAYMCQSDFLAAHVRELQVTALGLTTNCAWWEGNCRGGFYSLAVVDFLLITTPKVVSVDVPAPKSWVIGYVVTQHAPAVATARCQCGTDNHTRGPGHSAWCPLLDTGAE